MQRLLARTARAVSVFLRPFNRTRHESPAASANGATPGTNLHDASLAERDAYWKTRQDIAPQDQMREWEASMDALLAPYTTDPAKREHLAFLRRLLRHNPAQPLDTVEVTAKAVYRVFFQEANGDIESFVRRIIATSTQREIARNHDFISDLALMYGEESAKRVLPLLPTLTAATHHQNGSAASPPSPSLSLGTDNQSGEDVTITLTDRSMGQYGIGSTGKGKTTLLLNMILSDSRAGHGLAVFDPHVDLVRAVISGLPPHRLKDVLLLQITDADFPVGINLYQCPQPRTITTIAAVSSFVSHVFEKVWGAGTETPRLMMVLRAINRVLIENSHHGATFCEIPLLLSSDTVRSKMVESLSNSSIASFWEGYNRRSQRDRDELVSSTLNKVVSFLDQDLIRNIVGQSKTTLDLRRIMDEGKILLVSLSPQYSEASELIGSVLIGQILMAAFSRADTPEEKRRPFMLYCDEYQRFATSDFATLLAEARNFKIITILSNQTLEQLDPANQAAVLQVGIQAAFQVSGNDSKILARSYNSEPPLEPDGVEPVRAPVADVIGHLVLHGHSDPRVAKFAQSSLQNLEHFLHKPPTQEHPQWLASYLCLEGTLTLTERNVTRGREFLNENLYQCMLERRADVQLYTLAIYILSVAQGDGREFVLSPYVKGSLGYLREFRAGAERLGHPAFLPDSAARWVSSCPKKEKWMAEAIVTMLTELRYCMQALARDPLLTATGQYVQRYKQRSYQDVENAIANCLSTLPRFHAKVRLPSGTEHTILTHPAPQLLSEREIDERISAIKQRMLFLGITKPYKEVEQEIALRHAKLLECPDAVPPPPSHQNSRRNNGRVKPPSHR